MIEQRRLTKSGRKLQSHSASQAPSCTATGVSVLLVDHLLNAGVGTTTLQLQLCVSS
jgi:hypothetical protein